MVVREKRNSHHTTAGQSLHEVGVKDGLLKTADDQQNSFYLDSYTSLSFL